MQKGELLKYFCAIAAKRLSEVEANPQSSNQHEFNGAKALKDLLGNDRCKFQASFIYADDRIESLTASTIELTWYDARDNHPTRSEYRLYFSYSEAMNSMKAGDLLLLAKKHSGEFYVIVAEKDSTIENQLTWLFDLDENVIKNSFEGKFSESSNKIDFITASILESLDITYESENESFLEDMLNKFGSTFPSATLFSQYARSKVSNYDAITAPDTTLFRWMEIEDQLFRTFEKHIVGEHLRKPFDDVDKFVSYSLSVLNRRKARAGRAFENHWEEILRQNNIMYSRGAVTENKSKPDFIFPGVKQYSDQNFDTNKLYLLGIKTSCKDRWRQVLSEGQRIPHKHLSTLEPSISRQQIQEMKSNKLTLVIPAPIHDTYAEDLRSQILSVSEFIEMVRSNKTL